MFNNLFAKNNESETDETKYREVDQLVGEKNLENQLPIDVYQNDKEIIIKSDIAGVKPEDLKIALHNDLLTIKCQRFNDLAISDEDYFYKECSYGFFSRSIILPSEVDNHKVEASLENGVLSINLKKINPKKIEVKTS